MLEGEGVSYPKLGTYALRYVRELQCLNTSTSNYLILRELSFEPFCVKIGSILISVSGNKFLFLLFLSNLHLYKIFTRKSVVLIGIFSSLL